MPAAVGTFVLWLGGSAAAAAAAVTIATFLIKAAISLAINAIISSLTRDRGGDSSFSNAQTARAFTVAQAAAPYEYVLGETIKGGKFAFRHAQDIQAIVQVSDHATLYPTLGDRRFSPTRSPFIEDKGVRYISDSDGDDYIYTNLTKVGGALGDPLGFDEYRLVGLVYEVSTDIGLYDPFDEFPIYRNLLFTYTYQSATETSGRELLMVIWVAAHQVEEIGNVFFDDEEIQLYPDGDETTGVWRPHNRFQNWVFINKHLGAPGQAADLMLRNRAPHMWTEAHTGEGWAYITVRLIRNYDIFTTGIPNIRVRMKGHNQIYDTRDDTYKYTTNAALCNAWYLNEPEIGMKAAYGDSISNEDLIVAANGCDEDVPLKAGGTEKRYVCMGVFDVAAAPELIIGRLLSSMAGKLARVGGRWILKAGIYTAPTITISPKHFHGSVSMNTLVSRQDACNSVHGLYASAETGYQAVNYPAITSDQFVTEDNGEHLPLYIDFPFTPTASMCQRLAMIELLTHRFQVTLNGEMSIDILQLQALDTLYVDFPLFGSQQDVYEIGEMRLSLKDMIIRTTFRQTSPAIYDWSTDLEKPLPQTNQMRLPSPWSVAAPGAITVVESEHKQVGLPTGTKAAVAWVASADAVSYDVQWRKLGDAAWQISSYVTQPNLEIFNLEATTYVIRVLARNGIGRPSAWVSKDVTFLGFQGVPLAPTGLTAVQLEDGVHLSWVNASTGDDFRGVTVYRASDGAVLAVDLQDSQFAVGLLPVGNHTFRVRSFFKNNKGSEFATVALDVVGPAGGNITAAIVGGNVLLNWSGFTSGFRIGSYEVRNLDTNSWNPAIATSKILFSTSLQVSALFVGTQYFMVRAIDIAGNQQLVQAAVAVTITPPKQVTIRSLVFGNTVVLNWGSAETVLPLKGYNIRRWNAAHSLLLFSGFVNAEFSIQTVDVGGTYLYEVEGVDAAGNIGAVSSISVTMVSPNAFILHSNFDSAFDGTVTNVHVMPGEKLVFPVNITETITAKYSGAFTTFQEQHDAGYPIYAQPGLGTGQYVDVVRDLGAVLPSSQITVSLSVEQLDGTVAIEPTIRVKLNIGDSWTEFTNTYSALATNFRYLQIVLNFSASSGDVAKITAMNIRADLNRVDDPGGKITTSTGGATTVNFNQTFLDVTNININPLGSSNAITDVHWAVDSAYDVPNPTSFNISAWSKTTGNRVAWDFTWSATGY